MAKYAPIYMNAYDGPDDSEAPELVNLTFEAETAVAAGIVADTAVGAVIGQLSGKTAGSTLSTTSTVLSIDGLDVKTAVTPLEVGPLTLSVTETLGSATRTTTLNMPAVIAGGMS